MMDTIIESALIERLADRLPRSPHQLNARWESDAELIRLPGGVMLAITTDCIAEEIATGLYADAELIGWMTVLVNASDLSAVGARPLGILLNETLPADLDGTFVEVLQRGIARACVACDLPVLGGDTNSGTHLQLAATAVGVVEDGRPMTRMGCRPGDLLFASGPLGLGGAYALGRLTDRDAAEIIAYRPKPRLAEGRALRHLASSCIDTSDGVIPSLDELMRLNRVGFRIDRPLEEIIDPAALAACASAGLPAWTLLAGPHGEFELLFTLPAAHAEKFISDAFATGWEPVRLGIVESSQTLLVPDSDGLAVIDTARVRNLFLEIGHDVQAYATGLLNLIEPVEPVDQNP